MKKILLNNLAFKVLSVVLAVSLWFFITQRGQSEIIVEASLEFKNVPAGTELLKQSIKKASLNIKAHERVLKNLRPLDVRVVMDLSDAKIGENTYTIDSGNVFSPRSVKVLRIDPASVKVTLDQSITKVVPVRAVLSGTLDRGYRVLSVEITPQVIQIEGARTEIARVVVLKTESIDITGLHANLEQEVRLNMDGRNIRTKISDVTVKIRIEGAGK